MTLHARRWSLATLLIVALAEAQAERALPSPHAPHLVSASAPGVTPLGGVSRSFHYTDAARPTVPLKVLNDADERLCIALETSPNRDQPECIAGCEAAHGKVMPRDGRGAQAHNSRVERNSRERCAMGILEPARALESKGAVCAWIRRAR